MVISVLSGKGGTGKTTVVAALSEIAKAKIKVDCDVDAPNLYLFYKGTDSKTKSFYGSKKAEVDHRLCIECGSCEEVCRFEAIEKGKINPYNCEGCGACLLVCPQEAISLTDEKTATTCMTTTDKGLLSRAKMEIGSDGSGKLVTQVRKNAEPFVKEEDLVILDGSPGIGCSVIASLTDIDIALIITEPTRSGLEDLKRIVELTEHFETKGMVCINKYDINPDMTKEIEEFAKRKNLVVVGEIPFDSFVMESINSLQPITSFEKSPAKKAIEKMWERIDALNIRNKA